MRWRREDLRLADHPALASAVESGRPVLCIYILDTESTGLRPPGGASRWWLHHSLAALDNDLRKIGGRLDIFHGAAQEVLERLADATGAASLVVVSNRLPALGWSGTTIEDIGEVMPMFPLTVDGLTEGMALLNRGVRR